MASKSMVKKMKKHRCNSEWGHDKFHASKKTIEKYGPTDGCPTCTSIIVTGTTTGRMGVNHNDICRKVVLEKMRNDPTYRHLMQKHENKLSMAQNNITNGEGQKSKVLHKCTETWKNRKDAEQGTDAI